MRVGDNFCPGILHAVPAKDGLLIRIRVPGGLIRSSQLSAISDIDQLPVKMVGENPVRVEDIGVAKDAQQIQTNVVRVDGQRSVYVPVL